MDPRRQPQQPVQPDSAPRHRAGALDPRSKLFVRILVILLIVVAACGVIFFVDRAVSAITANDSIKSNEFQALFLTNGQVYFGKLSHINGGYVKLTDIFYLQGNNANSQTTVQPSTSSSQLSLVKLGSELHGPEDAMFVSRSQVLFWENLKDSGKVVQAIDKYQSNN